MIRSLLTLGGAQVLSWGGAALLAVLLPRYLGDVNLGKLAFALAFTGLVGLVADMGAATFVTKEIACAPERAALLTSSALAMRLPLGVLAAVLVAVSVTVSGYDSLTRDVVYVLGLGIVLEALVKMVTGALQGFQAMASLAACSLLTKLTYAALAAALLLGGAGPREVALAWIASQAVALGVGLLAVRRYVALAPFVDRSTCRRIFLGGLPFFLWQAALVVYGQIDAVLLSFLTHDAVVGWYAAAYRLVTIPLFIPSIVVTVLFPALAAAAADGPAFATLARRALHGVVLLSLPMALGIMLLADRLISLLGYPEPFVHSLVPTILLAAHIPIVGMDMVIGTVLNARDRQRQWALTGVAAAVLNPLLNLAAIPYTQAVYGNGAIGAALVTTLTEVFMLCVALRLVPSGVFGRATLVDVLKALLAGLVMAAIVWEARDLSLIAAVVLGALAYAGTALAVGAVTVGELQQLWLHAIRSPRRGCGSLIGGQA